MSLLPVDEALRRLLTDIQPTAAETVPLAEASGRTLAADLAGLRDQPPFAASAMDGYAVRSTDAQPGSRLTVKGTSRAGERFAGSLGPGEAVRIFTGAPVPEGADAILIQENAERDGDSVVVREAVAEGRFVRRMGLDFRAGEVILHGGDVLKPRTVALAAAMGHAEVPVRRRPNVAILSNGDELVPPGAAIGADQIFSSNGFGLSALVRESGGNANDLGIAPDRREAISAAVDSAAGSDILVVVGGASVGDHDLVQAALTERGMALDFWRIAMRPGKPLMVGQLGGLRVLGLPGNPVSALVCAYVFLRPLIRSVLGQAPVAEVGTALLGADLPANDERQDYLRATTSKSAEGRVATPFQIQDSSMLANFARSDALIVRPPYAPAARAGEKVPILAL